MKKERSWIESIITIVIVIAVTTVLSKITIGGIKEMQYDMQHSKETQKIEDIKLNKDKFSKHIDSVFENKYKGVMLKYHKLEDKKEDSLVTMKIEDVLKTYSDLLSDYLNSFSVVYYKDMNDLKEKQLSCKDISKTIFVKKDKKEFVAPIIFNDKQLENIVKNNLTPLKNNDASLRERVNMNEIRSMIIIGNGFGHYLMSGDIKGFAYYEFNLDGDKYNKAYQVLKATGLTMEENDSMITKQSRFNFQFK